MFKCYDFCHIVYLDKKEHTAYFTGAMFLCYIFKPSELVSSDFDHTVYLMGVNNKTSRTTFLTSTVFIYYIFKPTALDIYGFDHTVYLLVS